LSYGELAAAAVLRECLERVGLAVTVGLAGVIPQEYLLLPQLALLKL
jgi:hypothetical protein